MAIHFYGNSFAPFWFLISAAFLITNANAFGQLPSERELPGAPRLAQLPGEDQLPNVAVAAELKVKDRPWLRLRSNGHIGRVWGLAFTGDSQRLASAGEDKELKVWNRLAPDKWSHERTLRWQIQRGPNGNIFAVASRGDLVAIGGHGATVRRGEIQIFDAATGELKHTLYDNDDGHLQVVRSLTFSQRERLILVSVDVTGKTIAWQQNPDTGNWSSRTFLPSDNVDLKSQRRLGSPVAVNDRVLIAPTYISKTDNVPQWQLAMLALENPRAKPTPLAAGRAHQMMVTAMATSSDGSKLATSDATGYLYLWSLDPPQLAQTIPSRQTRGVIRSLSFAPNGKSLLVGTEASSSPDGKGSVQLWNTTDITDAKLFFKESVARDVLACTYSNDDSHFAYSQGSSIHLRRADSRDAEPIQLRAAQRPIYNVAFSKSRPYRVAFSTQSRTVFHESFELEKVRIGDRQSLKRTEWNSKERGQGDWGLELKPNGFWLTQAGDRRAKLPLNPIYGRPTAWCWVPDSKGTPYAIAVGTDGQSNLYVFRLKQSGTAPILRQFRGHSSQINSVGVSSDGRYLVSGSHDRTLRIWKLEDFEKPDALLNRWGAAFEIHEGKLIVASAREDGPLHFRGVRRGDVITKIEWNFETESGVTEKADEILKQLETVGWQTMVTFHYSRQRVQQEAFALFPMWQQVASLAVAPNREWAFWTPSGFYDASFEGHRLFGWQINRGVDGLPDFFLADQMRKTLEKPDVMKQLLKSGSLQEAFRSTRALPPNRSHEMLANQYQLKPHISILSPRANHQIAGSVTKLRASVRIREGQKLVAPKAFANGVVATNRRQVQVKKDGEFIVHVFEWDAPLPSDAKLLIQVFAATDSEVTDEQRIVVEQKVDPDRAKSGRLFLFAAGVDNYRDAEIPTLETAVQNVSNVVDLLTRTSDGYFTNHTVALTNERATKSIWSVFTREFASQLRDGTSPDDLLIILLTGHGVRDPKTNRYYFVTPNAKADDLRAGRYADCISLDDLQAFADVPCRKLVILDTCHSGAFQPPDQTQLKAALRVLQQDMMFTLTASEGNEEAIEGLFSSALLAALKGQADEHRDGHVTLDEVVRFVKNEVATRSASQNFTQHATASPSELIESSQVPLTKP